VGKKEKERERERGGGERERKRKSGSVPFAHVAIDHNHSQQPVPRGFSLFKRCKWLVVNYNVGKRAPRENEGEEKEEKRKRKREGEKGRKSLRRK